MTPPDRMDAPTPDDQGTGVQNRDIYGEGFAAVYASSRYAVFSQRLARLALSLIERHGAPGDDLLDLACGAGAGTVALAKAGYSVSALDGSAVMVRYTEERARAQGVKLGLVQRQDMRSFALPHEFGIVTCLFDALNYLLTEDELAAVFDRVARVLRPGGLFVFDMNTPRGLATRWGTKDVVSTARTHLFEVNQNRYERETCTNTTTTTIFVREDGTDLFRRFVEVHRERAYPVEAVIELLRQAELTAISIQALTDSYQGMAAGLSEWTDDAGRVVIVARRV